MESREQLEYPGDETEPPESPFEVALAIEQETLPIDQALHVQAVRSVLLSSEYDSASISLAIVDDPTIHQLNVQYLQHDYPTDVLSFVLEDDGQTLQGQLVVSADTAVANAARYGWSSRDELLLYVVHGALHLVGYNDKDPLDRAAMRTAEAEHLQKLGIALPAGHARMSEDQS